ncbi:MAG: VWA domain-containing protein [Anaerolineae bacterium]
MAGEVQLTLSLSKDTLLWMQNPQLAYVLLEIMPSQILANVQVPLNFAFVLDQSGSMDDAGKIDRLRDATKHAIDLLHAEDIVSIVAFSTDPRVVVSGQPARDKNSLKQQVEQLKAGGGTKMARALREGLRQVRQRQGGTRVNRIVLLTDGQTDGDDAECVHLAEEAGRDGIKITALGLGADWNENLLTDVGGRSGGETGYIAQPQEIARYFKEVVQQMQGGIVQNAHLTMRLVEGPTPRRVWRVAPLISDLGINPNPSRDIQVPLGELVKDQGQGILVELAVPSRNDGRYRIGQADLSYDIPVMGLQDQHVRADVMLSFTRNPALAQAINPRVMNIVEKVTAFNLQTRALQDLQNNNNAGATQKLRQAATMLINQGETNLAQTMRLEADRLESQGQMSDEGRKTIKFQSGKTVRLGPKTNTP